MTHFFIVLQVIQIWFEVQRTWSHLESIFIGSEDIRKQLPEDSARFDQIDTDFKVITSCRYLTHKPYFFARNKISIFFLLRDGDLLIL